MAAAFMESTACLCLDSLPEGETTVGVRIDIQHLKASAVGETLTCRATLVRQEGRRYWFDIRVLNARGEEVAVASHERVRVDSGRFMAKVQAAVQ
jgi:predicted thioesterase